MDMKSPLAKLGAACASITAIAGLWILFGLPTPATSEDIKKLNRQQLDTAIRANQNSLRFYLMTPPKQDDAQARAFWMESLEQTREQLKAYKTRRIELDK